MNTHQRVDSYLKQTGRSRLTPRQQRRAVHKSRRAQVRANTAEMRAGMSGEVYERDEPVGGPLPEGVEGYPLGGRGPLTDATPGGME